MNRYFIVLAIASLTAYQAASGASNATPRTREGCSLRGICTATVNFCKAAPSGIARAFTSCRRRNEDGSYGQVDLKIGYENWLSNPSLDDLELYKKGRLEDMDKARMPWGHLVRLGFWLGLAAVFLETCPEPSVAELGARLCGLFGWIESPRNAKATRVRKEIKKIRDIVDKDQQGSTVSRSPEESYRVLQRLSERDVLTPIVEMLCKKGLCANAFAYHRDRKRATDFIVNLLHQHGHRISQSLILQYLDAVEDFNEHFKIAKQDFCSTTTKDSTQQYQKAADYLIQHLANNQNTVPVIRLITSDTFEELLDLYLVEIFKDEGFEKERCRKAILAIKPLEYSELTINITTETNSSSSSSSSSYSVPTTPETPNVSSGNSLLSNQGTAGLSPLRLPETASTATAQDIELTTV